MYRLQLYMHTYSLPYMHSCERTYIHIHTSCVCRHDVCALGWTSLGLSTPTANQQLPVPAPEAES